MANLAHLYGENFTFQQVLYLASLWIGILLVHSTFFYQSAGGMLQANSNLNIINNVSPWVGRNVMVDVHNKVLPHAQLIMG